ncbi:MAG: hypothetical protein K0Q65_2874, partial [Clostridia bacterium]|nr:hypothetical protein [Clostridia bacterium]
MKATGLSKSFRVKVSLLMVILMVIPMLVTVAFTEI